MHLKSREYKERVPKVQQPPRIMRLMQFWHGEIR